MIRNFKSSDLPILQSFCKDFRFVEPSTLTVADGVVEVDGQIKAYGSVRLTSEVFLIVNPDASRVEKADAVQELFIVGKEMSRKKGLDSWLAFVKSGDSFMRTLSHRFGFRRVDEKCFILDLEG